MTPPACAGLPRRHVLFLVLSLALLPGVPRPASGQGLTLRLAPESQLVRWDEGVALDDAAFLGGGVSLGFGRYVILRAGYGSAGTVDTRFGEAGFRAADGSLLPENRVRTSLFGGGVLLRLGDQRVAPVLSGRGAILQMEPEGRDRMRQIVAGWGGGLDLRLAPWVDGQILLERVKLRLDRALLVEPGAPPASDPEAGVTRDGLALGASLGVRLGASRSSGRADEVDRGIGDLLDGRTGGLLVPLEAQVGVLRFDDALGLGDQRVAGIRTGVDLGPYFGLRGAYWRGVTDAFDDVQGISGWRGEIQFNLGRVTEASPFLLLGAGQTRFDDAYLADAGVALEDQSQVIVGAGLGLPVGERARLTFTLRDQISAAGDLDDAASPSDLRHSLELSAGVSVLLYGKRQRERGGVPAASDSLDYRSDRVLAIPIPKEGELYVRYGPGERTLPMGAGAVDSMSARPAPGTGTAPAQTGSDSLSTPLPGEDPSVAALRRQVEELTRLVRESMVLQAAGTKAGQGTSVTVNTGGGAAGEGGALAEPFLRAVEGRLARSTLDDRHGGLALSAEAYLGSLGGDPRLAPFVGLDLGRHGVDGEVEGVAVDGSVRTLGVHAGVTAALGRLGPLWPTAGVFMAASRERASADLEAHRDALDRRFGGLALGPGVMLGAAYRADDGDGRLVTAAWRKTWAGSSSRWSFEAGMRLAFGPGPREVGPFSVRPSAAAAPTPDATPGGAAAPSPAAAEPTDSLRALLARVDSLEARVLRETEARQRAQGRADSLAAAAAAEVRAREREAEEAARRVAALVARLDSVADASPRIVGVEASDTLVRVVLGGDLFDVGATGISPEARGEVAGLSPLLEALRGGAIRVEGHTDDSGSEEANLAISRLRAEAVRDALVDGGTPAEAAVAVGRGEGAPVADNDTRAGRARNRRVEILVRR